MSTCLSRSSWLHVLDFVSCLDFPVPLRLRFGPHLEQTLVRMCCHPHARRPNQTSPLLLIHTLSPRGSAHMYRLRQGRSHRGPVSQRVANNRQASPQPAGRNTTSERFLGTWQGRGDLSVIVTSHRPVHCSRALCCHSGSSYCVTSVSCRTGVWFSVPTVYTCTCGGVHRAGTSSLCCTCACHGVPRAGTSSVLRFASTSTGVRRACVFSLCRTFCYCNRELNSLPVVPTVYICTCGGVLCAGTTRLVLVRSQVASLSFPLSQRAALVTTLGP